MSTSPLITYVATVGLNARDKKGYVTWAIGETIEAARAQLERDIDDGDHGERILNITQLDVILNRIAGLVQDGHEIVCSHKSESGAAGPIVFTDGTAAKDDPDAVGFGYPYGQQPPWQHRLPWGTISDARRYARIVGLDEVRSW